MDCLPDIRVLPKVFTGRHPFNELASPVVTPKIVDDKCPARPQEARVLGLTDSIWGMAVRCWHRDPAQRPTMTEAVGLVREWPVFSPPCNQNHDTPCSYRITTLWTVITDIPVKVLTNNILPFCEAKDVLSLGCTLCLTARLWRQRPFRSNAAGISQPSLRDPEVYMCGGHSETPSSAGTRKLCLKWTGIIPRRP